MVITGDDELDKRWFFDEMQPRAQPGAHTLTSPILAIRTPIPVATLHNTSLPSQSKPYLN